MPIIKHRVIAPKNEYPDAGVRMEAQDRLDASRLIRNQQIIGIEIIDGFPGGPNNDEIRIIFDNDKTICIDAYSNATHVTVGSVDDRVEGE